MGGKVMVDYIDKFNNDVGYLWLVILKNCVYYMGNKMEFWLKDEVEKLKNMLNIINIINEYFNFEVKFYFWMVRVMGKFIYKMILKIFIGRRLFLNYVGIKFVEY